MRIKELSIFKLVGIFVHEAVRRICFLETYNKCYIFTYSNINYGLGF